MCISVHLCMYWLDSDAPVSLVKTSDLPYLRPPVTGLPCCGNSRSVYPQLCRV